MKQPKPLAPVRPNLGLEIAYRRAMQRMIAAMHADVLRQVRAGYEGKTEPAMALDRASPRELQAIMRALGRKWNARFDKAAPELAAYFATRAADRADGALAGILKRAGFAISFRLTRQVREVIAAAVAENVTLIKSIPAQYLAQVEGHVMRAVQVGGDLAPLTRALNETFGVTKRRAAFIARDQNAKATAVVQRVRQGELGITEAVWMHSGGGRHPRPSHVKAGRDRTRYPIAEGWLDPALNRRIWPGTEPNCRCQARPIMPFETRNAGATG